MTAVAGNSPEIVFVWLGDTLPEWAKVSLRIARRTSGLSTVLICSRKAGVFDGVARQVWLEDFYEPREDKWTAKKGIRYGFRNGFWRKAFERFIVLEQYAESHGISCLFHAEVDNLVFRLDGLSQRLDGVGRGFFCPRDAKTRGIASLVYVNDTTTLRQMVEAFFDDRIPVTSDMELLGHMLQHDSRFYSLPTERSMADQPVQEWSTVPVEKTKGLFDAAAIGQFMFGIDPRNGGVFMWNGFVSEHRGCDVRNLRIAIDLEAGTCTVSKGSDRACATALYNIHVHSKLFETIADPKQLARIVDRLNQGMKTLLTVRLRQWRPIRALLSRMNMA